MRSIECKLGDYIVQKDNRNTDLVYGLDSVRGVNNLKQLMPTRADLDGRDLAKFLIVEPGDFVYNHRTSRHGGKFCIAYNNDSKPVICTEDYTVFSVADDSKDKLLDLWLFLFFNRPECDRYIMFSSWGSSTEFFNWSDMCDIELELPPVSIQQKYVDVYKAMLANQQSYERGLDNLKLLCDAYIENLRKNIRNHDKKNEHVVGLSTKKEFREAQSRVNREELGNYKIVEPDEFAFVPTTDTWKVLAFALNKFDRAVVVSPIYEVFSVDKTVIVPEYLSVWLSRKEFDRYARFNSWGSARENFSFEDMSNVSIPIPDISVQKAIAEIYAVYTIRKKINEQLKAQTKDICQILIKGSIEEARKEA